MHSAFSSQRKTPAADKVLGIVELLEMILLQVATPRDSNDASAFHTVMGICPRVCKLWDVVVMTSPAIQSATFRRPIKAPVEAKVKSSDEKHQDSDKTEDENQSSQIVSQNEKQPHHAQKSNAFRPMAIKAMPLMMPLTCRTFLVWLNRTINEMVSQPGNPAGDLSCLPDEFDRQNFPPVKFSLYPLTNINMYLQYEGDSSYARRMGFDPFSLDEVQVRQGRRGKGLPRNAMCMWSNNTGIETTEVVNMVGMLSRSMKERNEGNKLAWVELQLTGEREGGDRCFRSEKIVVGRRLGTGLDGESKQMKEVWKKIKEDCA
ncbi:hypothetical protein ABW19_dt0207454 [Dactylella cylindrospora]|nr:hypothetical protein ABW19_dt0207454 [Dactylella cylindrospora]